MYLWMVLPGIFLLSFLISRRMAGLEGRILLDQPIARSAHTVATPRGGGLAIVLALAVWVAGLGYFGLLDGRILLVLACSIPVAITGFIDDLRGLPVRVRLPVHLLTAAAALAVLGTPPVGLFGNWIELPQLLQSVLMAVALVWLLNLYNFMDGIDMLAAAQCLFVCSAAAFLLLDLQPGLALVCAGLFAATLGFLLLNLPPARLFMGDVGSTFLGFFIGLMALLTHYQQSLTVWVWLLLMGTFVADTTYTLIVRAISGYSVTEGHNTHAFQRLARRLGRHHPVVTLYMCVNLFWLFPLAWLASIHPEQGVVLCISGIVPLMAIAGMLGAGRTTPAMEANTAANKNS